MPMPTPPQTPQALPAPPTVPPPGAIPAPQALPGGMNVPIEVLQVQAQAINAQLNVLRSQQRDILRSLRGGDAQARAVTMEQLGQVNAQMTALTGQLASVEAQLAIRQGQTARMYPPTMPMRRPGMDPDVVAGLWFAFIFAVLMPISIGVARRIWRGKAVPAPVRNDDSAQRLERLEHAIDTIAIEIERVSESQRFMTKIMADRPSSGLGSRDSGLGIAGAASSGAAQGGADPAPLRALGAGPMEPVPIPERQAVRQ